MSENQNHITNLHIENFKSIKQMDLNCKRINIFVGKPNVGKSNILEALSVLSGYDSLKDVVRFTKTFELFYDNEDNSIIKIMTDQASVFIAKERHSSYYNFVQSKSKDEIETIANLTFDNTSTLVNFLRNAENIHTTMYLRHKTLDESGKESFIQSYGLATTNIRRYTFDDHIKVFNESSSYFLSAPFGKNLLTIITVNKDLRDYVSGIFEAYGLEFLIDQRNNTFEIQKKSGGIVYKYDYALIADTLKRMIFYMAAIKSNEDSILLFEEPEAHSFPPYTRRLGLEMVESTSNQFFLATHSPYLLSSIIENTTYADCAVFITKYENYQTSVKELSEEEVKDMIDYGQDVFINYKAFADNE